MIFLDFTTCLPWDFPYFPMDFATFFSSPDFFGEALVQRALRFGRFGEPAAAHLQLAPWVTDGGTTYSLVGGFNIPSGKLT